MILFTMNDIYFSGWLHNIQSYSRQTQSPYVFNMEDPLKGLSLYKDKSK